MTDEEKRLIIGDNSTKTTYDCKGYNALCMPSTWECFSGGQGNPNNTPTLQSATAKGNTLYLDLYVCVYHDDKPNSEIWETVKFTFKNYNNIEKVYCWKQQYEPTDEKSYETSPEYYTFVVNNLVTTSTNTKTGVTTVTGSNFNDEISFTNDQTEGYIVNAGAGNDTITGSTGDDTITGGTGENTINISNGEDVVNLTKNEKLIINSGEKTVSGLALGKNKNDLLVSFNDESTLTLKSFVKSNVVGSKGNVYLDDVDLNNMSNDSQHLISFDNDKATLKKNTATITGTRLSDEITVNGEDFESESEDEDISYKVAINAGEGNNKITLNSALNTNTIKAGSGADKIYLEDTSEGYDVVKRKRVARVTTVKAGNGANEIYVDGSGNNSIITGSGDDKFYFGNASGSNATTTIKAGKGTNTININNNDFGTVTLAEEKVSAKNNIVFNVNEESCDESTDPTDNFESYKFYKKGSSNDLIISNGKANDEESEETESKVVIKDYFTTGKKYATNLINDMNFDELLESGIDYTVTGAGTIKGTSYGETIIADDSEEDAVTKNDKIYGGKGNDLINAGKGKNQIFVYAGDGADVVENGGGTDTLIFKKGTKIKIGIDDTNLRLYYSNSKSDFILLEDVVEYYVNEDGLEAYQVNTADTSVKYLKIGSKTYSLESLVKRNTITGTEAMYNAGAVAGKTTHDDIYITDADTFKDGKTITISGNAGSDNIMIGSNVAINEEDDQYNVDPSKYKSVDIAPVVYTHTKANAKGVAAQDTTIGNYDRVVSYASNDGTYWAQSAVSDIKVYGWKEENNTDSANSADSTTLTGTNDIYNVYYKNQFTKLYDEAGEDDVLYIKDMNHEDLKLVFNISKDYTDFKTGLQEILGDDNSTTETDEQSDKSDAIISLINKSFQEVKIVTSADRDKFLSDPNNGLYSDLGIDIDYWGDKDSHASTLAEFDEGLLSKFGGGIERIVAKDGYYITSDDIASVAANVATWLSSYSEGAYDSLSAIFSDDSLSADALAGVVTAVKGCYDEIQWHAPNAAV